MKISSHSKPSNLFKEFGPGYADLLEKMLVFNPSKRATVDDILNHDLVKSFRKKEEETVCKKDISTPIDDNKKYSVEEYRKLIYGNKYHEVTKPKGLSSSLGAGSTSPKYQHPLNKTVVNFGQSKAEYRPEPLKKYSYDKGKNNYSEESSKKLGEKTNVKYIRSFNNLSKA